MPPRCFRQPDVDGGLVGGASLVAADFHAIVAAAALTSPVRNLQSSPTMLLFLNVIYVLIAIAMIALILMQRGAGAQAGSGFGAGASAHGVRFARRFELPVEVDQVAGDRVLRDQPVHGLERDAQQRRGTTAAAPQKGADGGSAGGSGAPHG